MSAGLRAMRAAALMVAGAPWWAEHARAAEIQLLQWNLHGECFTRCGGHNLKHCDRNYPACKTNSTAFLAELLEGRHAPGGPPDFAGVEQLGDHHFLTSGLPKWGRTVHTCGGVEGFGMYPFDVAVLYYDHLKWQPISQPVGGCMEHVWGSKVNNYRAYVMQTFRRKDLRSGSASEEAGRELEDEQDHGTSKVVVIVAHYSHAVWGLPEMRQQLGAMQNRTGVKQLILLADTNRECGTSSWSLMHALYPPASQVVSAQLHRTCCVPRFQHCYDRIIAANFPGSRGAMPTSLPLPEFVVQDWSAPNQHHPIKAQLSYGVAPAPEERLI